MKKLISLSVALIILLSAFGGFNVFAASEEMPYLYMDFEEDNINKLINDGIFASDKNGMFTKREWKADGLNGSDGCVSYTNGASGQMDFFYATAPFVLGQKYKYSMWVRYVTDLCGYEPAVRFIMYSRVVDGIDEAGKPVYKRAWKEVVLEKGTTAGDWVNYSAEFVWDGSVWPSGGTKYVEADPTDKPKEFSIRIGSASGSLFEQLKDKDEYKNVANFKALFDIDDIALMPVVEAKQEDPQPTQYPFNKLIYSTFDNPYEDGKPFSAGYAMSNDAGANKAALNAGDGYLNMASPDGKYAYNELMIEKDGHQDILYSANHTYQLKFKYRIQEMFTTTDLSATKGHLGIKLKATSSSLSTTDVNGLTGMESWSVIPYLNCFDIDGQWHDFSCTFKLEFKTFAELYRNGAPLILGLVPYLNAGNRFVGVHINMDFDDLEIMDLGVVSNGDIEVGADKVGLVTRGNSAPSLIEKSYTVSGWNTTNATVAQSSDVSADSDGVSSLKVNVTANGGNTYQGIALEKSQPKYKMSFRAKGADTLADGEQVPFAVVLDRYAATTEQSQEYYDTPNYEFYIGENDVIKSDTYSYSDTDKSAQEWQLTNEWQNYECIIDNTFDAIPGHEGVNKTYIKPRQPFMYFDVNGNQAGTEYYIDDIVIEEYFEPTIYKSPYVTSITHTSGDLVDGETISIEYDYMSEIDALEGKTVARVMISDSADGNGWACFEQIKPVDGAFSYKIPQNALGKKLKIEITPLDIENNLGVTSEMVIGEVKNSFSVDAEIGEWNAGTLTATAEVGVNLPTGQSRNATAILVLYDDANKMVTAPVSQSGTASYGNSCTINLAIPYAETSATHAKLYVWSGTSLDDAGEYVYCNEVSSVK